MRVDVTGAEQLRAVARRLREVGDASLRRELYAGLTRAVKPLKAAVIGEIGGYVPAGYARLLASSIRVRTATRGGRGARIRVTTTAKGLGQKRDLSAVNAGLLRHPVYGRTRFVKASRKAKYRNVAQANPWAAQRVRPGFFDQPALRLGGDVLRECEQVIADMASKVERG